jgi:hypothetical protein
MHVTAAPAHTGALKFGIERRGQFWGTAVVTAWPKKAVEARVRIVRRANRKRQSGNARRNIGRLPAGASRKKGYAALKRDAPPLEIETLAGIISIAHSRWRRTIKKSPAGGLGFSGSIRLARSINIWPTPAPESRS